MVPFAVIGALISNSSVKASSEYHPPNIYPSLSGASMEIVSPFVTVLVTVLSP